MLLKENPDNKKSPNAGDAEYPEFYSNEHYETIEEALKVFQDDDLLFEPGAEFSYTTHGFTLLSAVIESVSGKEWLNTQYMRNSNLVYVPKMEYVHKVNIFGLKMMVKSGLEKNILKFLHAQNYFFQQV